MSSDLPTLDKLVIDLVDKAYPGDNSAERLLYCMLARKAAEELSNGVTTTTVNRTPTVFVEARP